MRTLATRRTAAATYVVAFLLLASLPSTSGDDRATTPLELGGFVLTGDEASTVRGASVTLLIYDTAQSLRHSNFTVTGSDGNFSFTVPAAEWDPGWNATVRATYTLVGASREANLTLTAASQQEQNVTLLWNRSLGVDVTASAPRISTARDGQPTFLVNVTNGGNDTDAVLLWAQTPIPSIQADFQPTNRSELAPGERERLSLVVTGSGVGPGDYDITVGWRSEWFPSERGSLVLTWTIEPEVSLSVFAANVSWWPDPVMKDDSVLLNCTVSNTGRDGAPGANVTLEIIHPVDGLVHWDRLPRDVPPLSETVTSFLWTAEYAVDPFLLRFEVEHSLDALHGDNLAEVDLTVGVRNEPPTVEFTSPANGTSVNATITVGLSVDDPDTLVEAVKYRLDGGDWTDLPVGPAPSLEWDTTEVPDGWHVLEAYARDQYATSAIARLELKVENKGPNHPPEIYIGSPQEGDVVQGVLRAEGSAFDQDDYLERVDYRIDGGDWEVANGTNRWNLSADVSTLAEGEHVLDVRAFDGIDLSEVVSVRFAVTEQEAMALILTLGLDPPTILQGGRVRVYGDLVYDNGVRASGLQVRMEGPVGLLVFKTSDARGQFELMTTAPSAVGEHEYLASTTDSHNLAASNATTLRVLKTLAPDLEVSKVNVPLEIAAVRRNLTVVVDVRNLGIESGNGTLRAWAGYPGTGELLHEKNITIYEENTFTFHWTPTEPGEVDLTVEIVDVLPSDANLSNNRKVVVVDVRGLPDLIIERVLLSNPNPYENVTVTVSVRVANLGSLNASCEVELLVDGLEEEDRTGLKELSVKAGSFSHIMFEWTPVRGRHRLYVQIINTDPEEAITDNNRASMQVDVVEEPPPPEGEGTTVPGAGMAAALTALAVACLARIGGRRPHRRGLA